MRCGSWRSVEAAEEGARAISLLLPCSFISTGINLRQRFRLGRKRSVLSKEKEKPADLPLTSGERLYFRALDFF